MGFVYECALVDLQFRLEGEARQRQELQKVELLYPGSSATNCMAVGREFWIAADGGQSSIDQDRAAPRTH